MRLPFPTLLLSLMPLACGGPSVGEIISKQVTMTVTGVASAPDVAALGEPAGGLGVSRVYLSSSALTLVPCDEDASPITLEARGYDLLAESVPHESIGTAVSELCAIRLDLDPVSRNATEGVPEDASLYVAGTDAEGAAFTLSTTMSTAVLLEAVSGVPFGELPLLLGFDVSVALAGVPLGEDMTEEAQALFDAQTEAAFALYADENENQAFDEAERTPIAVARAPR